MTCVTRVPVSNLGWDTILKEFSSVPPRNIWGTVSIGPQLFVSEFLLFIIFRQSYCSTLLYAASDIDSIIRKHKSAEVPDLLNIIKVETLQKLLLYDIGMWYI